MICNRVRKEKRFRQKIDDPDCENTLRLMCVPIVDRKSTNLNPVSMGCKGVINAVNKEQEFNLKECDKLQEYARGIARILDNVLIIENYYAIKNVLKGVSDASEKIEDGMNEYVGSVVKVKNSLQNLENTIKSVNTKK